MRKELESLKAEWIKDFKMLHGTAWGGAEPSDEEAEWAYQKAFAHLELSEEEFTKRYIEPAAKAAFQAVLKGEPLDDNTSAVLDSVFPIWRNLYGIEKDAQP